MLRKIQKFHKNKKGLEFKAAFFAILAISVTIIAVGSWITEWDTEYQSGITYDLAKDYNKLDEVSGEISKQQGNISVQTSVQGESFEGTSIRGVFGILNNIHSAFGVVFGSNGMIAAITERFGVPAWFRLFLVSAMIAAITFALIAVLFRLPRSSA